MEFVDTWRIEMGHSLAECAAIAIDLQDVQLVHALMVTGLLWPLRTPVAEFDVEAIGAVQRLLGTEAAQVLREVYGWSADDQFQTARDLQGRLLENASLDAAVSTLLKHFDTSTTFTRYLSKTSASGSVKATVETALSPVATYLESGELPKVFISYARVDGEELAQTIRQRLERQDISVWQDRVQMEGGRDWWLQITEALNQVDFMVLVATPGAIQSEMVRKEWRYARQQGVCVYPVLGSPNLQFDQLPRWMRSVHFYNLEFEWDKLVRDLNAPCETPRVPFMVDDIPADLVPRRSLLQQLVSLLVDQHGDSIVSTLALYGTGGYGKTMLVRAVCHTEEVRQAFDDGILWVSLGETPGDLTGRVVDLIEVLTGERPGYANLDAAEARLVQLLADRDILMVLDDVWNLAHLKPFLRGGTRCARVITTRNISALPPKTQGVEVENMDSHEAVALLSRGLPEGSDKLLRSLAQRLGGWPLLLSLTNGALRDRVFNDQQALNEALAYVNRALDKRGLTAFDAHNAAARDQAVSQTLGVSQDLLSAAERLRYAELAIFPADINIPLAELQLLWHATGGLDDFDTEELCHRLHQLSLLANFDLNNRYITVHSIVRNYLAHQQGDLLAELHRQFLAAYAVKLPMTPTGEPDWADLPFEHEYLWQNLAYHLLEARQPDQLICTVKKLSYLVAKTFLWSATAAEADLLAAQQVAPDDRELRALHQGFSQSSHLLSDCTTMDEVGSTLHSRISHRPELTAITTDTAHPPAKTLLTTCHQLPDLPHPKLIRTLVGHGQVVLGCDISYDGRTLVSIDRTTTLKVWNAQTGAEQLTLTAQPDTVGNCCAISGDGLTVVSATWDGVLKIWDAATGAERYSIQAHAAPIFSVVASFDGAIVVTASKDKTLKVWNAQTGAERFTLEGHDRSVTGCSISKDGALIASIAANGVVKVWDSATGQVQTTLQDKDAQTFNPLASLTFTASSSTLLSCAISDNHQRLAAAQPDGSLKVWDLATQLELFTIRSAPNIWIENCLICKEIKLVVVALNDKTIKVYDVNQGKHLFTLEGHTRTVTSCAISLEGPYIVSASQDKTLKLWSARFDGKPAPENIYPASAQTCAVSADGQNVIFDAPGNLLCVVEAEIGLEKLSLKGHLRPITGCDISADGGTIVTTSQDRTLKIWDGATGAVRLELTGHQWGENSCQLTPDGKRLVVAADENLLKIWDTTTGAELLSRQGHERSIKDCAISADGRRMVTASADKTLKVWDATNGQLYHTLKGHTTSINCCAFSPDGRYIASAAMDNTLMIWNAHTGALERLLQGHTNAVFGCDFHPEGKYVLSASKDKTIRIWNVDTGRAVASLRVDGVLTGCAWYPNGRYFVAVGPRGVYFLQVVW
jgi:WD40 repeat protein